MRVEGDGLVAINGRTEKKRAVRRQMAEMVQQSEIKRQQSNQKKFKEELQRLLQ